MTQTSVAIEVRNLHKSFRLPGHEEARLRERILHPVKRKRPQEMRVFKGVSFDVHEGEFFGIVGRNGSGKSTLLRLLASIYRPDSGRIRVAGRLIPIIELGVGFNPELSARQNVIFNSVLLGLTPREARRRLDEILDFAEVTEFAELKLRNFSSGMRVRLAFAAAIQADPDVLAVDEVLAVGDAAFQEKCTDVLVQRRDAGKTVVLVSHKLPTIERYCDRAMLLERGRIDRLGDPGDVARRYMELNLERADGRLATSKATESGEGSGGPGSPARIAKLWVAGQNGMRRSTVEEKEPIELHVIVDVDRRIPGPGLRLELRSENGARVFGAINAGGDDEAEEVLPGERVRVRVTIDNRLSPGRYSVSCAAIASGAGRLVAASPARTIEFDVIGREQPEAGLVSLDHDVAIERERPPQIAPA